MPLPASFLVHTHGNPNPYNLPLGEHPRCSPVSCEVKGVVHEAPHHSQPAPIVVYIGYAKMLGKDPFCQSRSFKAREPVKRPLSRWASEITDISKIQWSSTLGFPRIQRHKNGVVP